MNVQAPCIVPVTVTGTAPSRCGTPRVAFAFTIIGGKVAAIEMIADAEPIGQLEVVLA